MSATKKIGIPTPTKKRGKIPTPEIIMAASDGDLAKAKAELKSGTDVNAVDRGGGTALHQAACNHHVPVVKALLAAEAAALRRSRATARDREASARRRSRARREGQ
jgi:hypothetical protein